jgi:DNA (cytosine-5)-methyltransferase 1
MLRIISECLPRYAIFENVSALLTGDSGRWFAQFLYDLAEIGYDAEWHCISASELGAHHHRDRVWIIAHPNNDGQLATKERESTKERGDSYAARQKSTEQSERCGSSSVNELLADSNNKRLQRGERLRVHIAENIKRSKRPHGAASECCDGGRGKGNPWHIEPELGRVADGIPNRSHRLKQLGNAVVPQIPEAIGRAIMQAEELYK